MKRKPTHRPRIHNTRSDAGPAEAAAAIADDTMLLEPDTVERYRVLNALTPDEYNAWAELRAKMLFDYLMRHDAVMAATAA